MGKQDACDYCESSRRGKHSSVNSVIRRLPFGRAGGSIGVITAAAAQPLAIDAGDELGQEEILPPPEGISWTHTSTLSHILLRTPAEPPRDCSSAVLEISSQKGEPRVGGTAADHRAE